MRMQHLKPYNFKKWIDENRHELVPPIANKVVFEDSDFIVMVVGGPNSRKDYHSDPVEEFYYQLEGRFQLRIMEDGKVRDIFLEQGDTLLLPPRVLHSPQRFAGTICLLIERKRPEGQLDGLLWFCEQCNHLLYEDFFQLKDIEQDFKPVTQRFFANAENTKCKKCGAVMLPPPSPTSAKGKTKSA